MLNPTIAAKLPDPLTPQEAKAAWEKTPSPSARRVATKLTQTGRPIHFSTIARWKADGWRDVPSRQHPIVEADLAVDVAAPVLAGDGIAASSNEANPENKAEDLDGLTEPNIVKLAARQTCITMIELAREVQRQATPLVGAKPAELALLLKALGKAVGAAARGFEQARLLAAANPPAPPAGDVTAGGATAVNPGTTT